MKYDKGTFVTVPNVSILKGQKPAVQALFMWLCVHSDSEGVCFPSRKLLASEIGSTPKTVDRHMGTLEELGIVKKTRRKKPGTNIFTSNVYQIMIDELKTNVKMSGPQGNTETKGRVKNDSITKPNTNYNQLTYTEEDNEEVTLPESAGKNYLNRLTYTYSKLFKLRKGFDPKINFPLFGRMMKSLSDDYSEVQIAALFLAMFTSDDKWFEENSYPIPAFKTSVTKFEDIIRNKSSFHFDDDKTLLVEVLTEIKRFK